MILFHQSGDQAAIRKAVSAARKQLAAAPMIDHLRIADAMIEVAKNHRNHSLAAALTEETANLRPKIITRAAFDKLVESAPSATFLHEKLTALMSQAIEVQDVAVIGLCGFTMRSLNKKMTAEAKAAADAKAAAEKAAKRARSAELARIREAEAAERRAFRRRAERRLSSNW